MLHPTTDLLQALGAITQGKHVALPGKTAQNVFVEGPYVLFCAHRHESTDALRRAGNVETFAVVQKRERWSFEKEQVTILHGGSATLTGAGLKKMEVPYQGMNVYVLECGVPPDARMEEKRFYKAAHWEAFRKKPEVHTISGAGRDIKIEVYPPHQVELSLSFPPFHARSFKGGTKLAGGAKDVETGKRAWTKETTRESTESDWSPWTGQSRSTKTESKDGVAGEAEDESGLQVVSKIAYTVDEAKVELDVLEILQAVLELGKTLQQILEQVMDNVPKVGWYFDLGYDLMEGSIKLAWGWKEYTDHRAFWAAAAAVELKVIALKAEIGIGVEGFQCELQVFGRLEGEAGISVGLQRATPDQHKELHVPFSTAITGKLGLRGSVSMVASAEGVVESALKLDDAAFDYSWVQGVSIKTKLVWSGLTAKIEASVGPQTKYVSAARSWEYEKELIKPVDLKEWAWPEQPESEPDELGPDEVREVFRERFEEGTRINVCDRQNGAWVGEDLTMDAILDQVMKAVGRVSNLLLTPKSVEALSFAIRAELDKRAEPRFYGVPVWGLSSVVGGTWPCVDQERFELFCHFELNTLLKTYVDPMKVAFEALKKSMAGP